LLTLCCGSGATLIDTTRDGSVYTLLMTRTAPGLLTFYALKINKLQARTYIIHTLNLYTLLGVFYGNPLIYLRDTKEGYTLYVRHTFIHAYHATETYDTP
jgi:hypothetical protein